MKTNRFKQDFQIENKLADSVLLNNNWSQNAYEIRLNQKQPLSTERASDRASVRASWDLDQFEMKTSTASYSTRSKDEPAALQLPNRLP